MELTEKPGKRAGFYIRCNSGGIAVTFAYSYIPWQKNKTMLFPNKAMLLCHGMCLCIDPEKPDPTVNRAACY